MNSKTDPSSAFEDLYRQSIAENIEVLSRFPANLQSALCLTETMSPSEDEATSLRVKTTVSECLNSMQTLVKLAADLDLLIDS